MRSDLSQHVARPRIIPRELLPPPTEFALHHLPADDDVVTRSLQSITHRFDLYWDWNQEDLSGICLAKENVWSRAARRKKARTEQGDQRASTNMEVGGEDVALGVKISKVRGHGEVVIRWLQGSDSMLLETFRGMLNRELRKACRAE